MKAIIFPGQGSQYKGMGKELFDIFKNETAVASSILGYDLKELCLEDPDRVLGFTQFTQPALYVVNAFRYYKIQDRNKPDYLLGHSLGEYNALLASGAFGFEDGLRMVQKRGALMAKASGGGMAAVLGLSEELVKEKLESGGFNTIDVANYNSPTQIVISGEKTDIEKVIKDFEKQNITVIPLAVSAAFHSRYMQPAANEFKDFLEEISFSNLEIPVIANITGKPYLDSEIRNYLSRQISSSVLWTNSIRFLMGKGVGDYEELGSGILTKMINEIKEKSTPLIFKEEQSNAVTGIVVKKQLDEIQNNLLAAKLGSTTFRSDYNVQYSYFSGSMYKGIASKELVVKMAKTKLLSFLGTGGMSSQEIEENLTYIQNYLTNKETFGANLLHQIGNLEAEMKIVNQFLEYNVNVIEASAFMHMTKALVYYRAVGMEKLSNGNIRAGNRIIAKISRPESAEIFMRPAPEKIINQLLEEGLISKIQAELSSKFAMADDICVEADSGGHTDSGVALVLFSAIKELNEQMQKEFNYKKVIRVGLAGGIGTPQAAACAFIMGADFIVTGSINQPTVESGMSDTVKQMLQDINVQDTTYAPAGDMFEFGAKVQVLKKGVLFPARANKLYELYKQYDSLSEIPPKVFERLEKNYFKKSIDEIWSETKIYLKKNGNESEISKAEQNQKYKMGLVFRWYFGYSTQKAFRGNPDFKVDFQVHTGPSLGAFNQWVKGTKYEKWQNRHVDIIAVKLMKETALLLERRLKEILI
ncbi:ACP S-malonyltransferase [Flavobacterium reichenbachii]|uniref:[acyl-carrier-protein] S-malonyltransferase n=1 Tax=Flavobacterium reichenbachii TaxID=362418 RepID=A0A085ZPH5_9FLAO|nr:ACP S-malonyltransferase [Flavobacterium reichenbachii]KFF06339.1 malonyl CoA-ACP transacylase [Flavobacterium reichenbachii]OXB17443.1 [acyl-carrier-protein] S-malonyltransferase [Flavobacterium reichenbachii]